MSSLCGGYIILDVVFIIIIIIIIICIPYLAFCTFRRLCLVIVTFPVPLHIHVYKPDMHIYKPVHDKTYNKTCSTGKDSDQPVHTLSLARVLVHPSLDSQEAVKGTCDQRRL